MSTEHFMEFATLIGGSITAAAYLPQVSKMVRHKSSLGHSLTAWTLWLVGAITILIYAFYIRDIVLIFIQTLYFAFTALILFLVYKYRINKNEDKN